MRSLMKIKVILLVVINLIFLGCDGDKCFYRTGKQIQNVMSVENYSRIHIYGIFEIELVQDTSYFVEGIGGENVLQNVELKYINDTLEIYNNNSCFWLRDYERPQLRLHFSDIREINLYETSHVYSTEPITDDLWFTVQTMLADVNLNINNQNFSFYVHYKTGGNYVFKGITENLYLSAYYCSVLDASELESKKARVNNQSIADFKVWVTDELSAEIHNRGNIYYKGTPVVIIDSLSSSGRVLPMP